MNAVLLSSSKKANIAHISKQQQQKKSKIYLTTVRQHYFKKTNPHLVKGNSRQRENKIRSTQLWNLKFGLIVIFTAKSYSEWNSEHTLATWVSHLSHIFSATKWILTKHQDLREKSYRKKKKKKRAHTFIWWKGITGHKKKPRYQT